MVLYSLASSSSGNCYLYDFGNTKIMIDVGITNKKVNEKLAELNIEIDEIDEFFITHEHSDHVKGLKVLSKNLNKVVNLTQGTLDSLSHELENYYIIEKNNVKQVNDVKVEIIQMSHDAQEPVGYIFHHEEKKYVHVSDTGYIIEEVREKITNATFYVLESNYEEQSLIANPKYPYNIKKRILSDKGHLSNNQCTSYLQEFVGEATEVVCLGHLSDKNNDKELVKLNNEGITGVEKYVLDKDETVKVTCK